MFVLGCDRISRSVTSRPDGKELEAYSQARGDRARLAAAQLPRAAGATSESVGRIEPVALFYGPMPTGVTVSRQGRIFVNFPRWGDEVRFTVAELQAGQPVAYPNEAVNRYDPDKLAENLVSVQSVVVDAEDRLWLLDTGSIQFGPVPEGAAKLVGVDLTTNKVVKTIHFPPDVALYTTYLNDIRFDLRRGTGGMAFITDSSAEGPNGIIVVDLATGESWRRLSDHPSTKAEENFVPIVEGEPFMQRPVRNASRPIKIGSDGIAISADGERLFYCPLASRKLYSVSVDALADRTIPEDQVAETVEEVTGRNFPSDGLESDAAGNLYLTDYENNAIHRRDPEGNWSVVARDPRMIWPDTMALADDGNLYFTANQLNRQKQYHEGRDLRQKPYVLFRTRVNAQPVRLVGPLTEPTTEPMEEAVEETPETPETMESTEPADETPGEAEEPMPATEESAGPEATTGGESPSGTEEEEASPE
jgi:sugar lactone lactonase YvrE